MGTPTLTVDYPGSKVVAFDLIEFWFGGARPLSQGAADLAAQVTVIVVGFDAQNRWKAVADPTFTPTVK